MMERSNKLFNRYFYILAGLLFAPILSACGGGSAATPVAPNNNGSETNGDSQPNSDSGVAPVEENTVGSSPTANRAPSSVNIPETIADGSKVVGFVTYTDEAPETVVIEIGGRDSAFFELQDQQLKLKDNADANAKDSYNITIEVTDEVNQSSGAIPFEIGVEPQDNAPSLRIETSGSDGVYTVQVFVNPGDDPLGGGIETYVINVSFDPNIGEFVSGSFATALDMSVPNIEDGSLSFTGITLNPHTDLSEQIMSFNIEVEPGQSAENLSLEFFQISIDGEAFANSEIAIA